MTQHLQESPNKYDALTNTTILTRRFMFALHAVFAFYFLIFCKCNSTKAVYIDAWFESLETFMSIISIFLKLWMSRRVNQTYFKYNKFDVNIALIFIATPDSDSSNSGKRNETLRRVADGWQSFSQILPAGWRRNLERLTIIWQMLSGHGNFCKYLFKGKMTRPNCIYGNASIDYAEQTFFHC